MKDHPKQKQGERTACEVRSPSKTKEEDTS
jgi:hypothetical protein